MKRLIFLLIFSILINSIIAHAQEVIGKWSGNLNIMGKELPIAFNISEDKGNVISTMDSPSQNAFGIPTDRTTFNGNKIEIVINNIGAFFQGTVSNGNITGTFNQNGIPFSITLTHNELQERLRPQTPTPPFSYDSEDISFTNAKANVKLAGTITKPSTDGTFPTVILVAGSGPNDRDETIFEHKPLWVIADHLTRNGFLVLRYDKRGVAQSTGKYATATTLDFAEDVKWAIEYLKSRDDVDISKIGIIGHSEGGVIAPMVAYERDDINFIVLLAGMGTKGIDLIIDQNEIALRQINTDSNIIADISKANKDLFEKAIKWQDNDADNTYIDILLDSIWNKSPSSTKGNADKERFITTTKSTLLSPWYRYFLNIEPTEYLLKTKCAVLAINGGKDMQVLADKNLEMIEYALRKGGNSNFKIRKYPNLNHLFQNSDTGQVSEYINIEETFSEEVLIDIVDWIKAVI